MLNFLKAGLFSHKNHAEEAEQIVPPAKGILAVWGGPNTGKTTVAVKIAQHLAAKKQNVILLLCDMTAPMLPCICPTSELEVERSLGSILAATHVTEPLVKNNCITLKHQPHLSVIGLLKGENVYTYPAYSETQAKELLACLKKIAPYVVVDCSSHIAWDVLSAVALLEADAVLRLAKCELKSISYLSSQLPLLKDIAWEADKQYKVASDVQAGDAQTQCVSVLGGVSFTLPHSPELLNQYLTGNLLQDLSLKDSREFRKEIGKIVSEVFGR